MLFLDGADRVCGSARPTYTLDMTVHEEQRVAQWFAAVAKVEGPEILGEAEHVLDESSSPQPWTGETVPNSGKLFLEIKEPSDKIDSGATKCCRGRSNMTASSAYCWLTYTRLSQ